MIKFTKRYFLLLINSSLFFFSFRASSQEKTIDDYINVATSNSPLLKDLNNQILINKLDSAIVLANYKPLVGLNSTGTYAPIIRGFGYDEALSNGKTFSALVTVNQSLLGKRRMNNEILGLSLLSDSVNNTVKLSVNDLRRNIITQYITAYSSQKQGEFDQKMYRVLKEEEVILKKLTQKNVYRQTDYLSFLVTLQQQELQMKQNQINALNDLAVLNYLSGVISTDSVKLVEPKLIPSSAQTLKQSLFLKQYHIDSLRIQNSRKIIELNYQPKIGVYADAGYNSSFIDQAYKNIGFSAGFTVSVPIYDGHQRKLQYNKLDILDRTRTNYRDFFIKQYTQQQVLLKQQLSQQESLFSKINEQIRFTESLIKIDGKLLQTGDITIADFILAIRNYLDAQNLSRQTNIARLELINQLNYWQQ
ncbi:MAG: hypothetical protein JWN56_2476 [Sphingobacteriales bacterium]|nr:hypothetical protein [Sphingobacteriales bacterium]